MSVLLYCTLDLNVFNYFLEMTALFMKKIIILGELNLDVNRVIMKE